MYGGLQGDNRYLFLFLGAGVLLLLAAIFGTRENDLDRIERDGKPLDASVVGARKHERRSSSSKGTGGTTTDYYITVRFAGPDGRTIQEGRQVGKDAFEQFEYASDQVPLATTVLMDTDGKWYAQPELEYQDTLLTLVAAACTVLAIVMFLLGLHSHYRRLHPRQPPRSLYADQPPGESPGPRASGPQQ